MYRAGQMQCLSFGHTKRLEIGRGGAILLDNYNDYVELKRMAYDGRDLSIKPWQNQTSWKVGYHYNMRLEDAVLGKQMLKSGKLHSLDSQVVDYPDVSVLNIEV
jgi:dTDP-4-amino-4,6-dideoxygalactose transaminase